MPVRYRFTAPRGTESRSCHCRIEFIPEDRANSGNREWVFSRASLNPRGTLLSCRFDLPKRFSPTWDEVGFLVTSTAIRAAAAD